MGMAATLMAQRIAGNVRAELARTRVQQQQIADALGENQQYVSRRITGLVAWRVDELAVVANILGVDPGDLFRLPGQRAGATHQKYRPSARPQRHLVLLEAA